MKNPTVVIDIGSGYTKIGHSNCDTPLFIPSVYGESTAKKTYEKTALDDLDFYIGNEAIQNNFHYPNERIMDDGQVKDWGKFEKFLTRLYFQYLSFPDDSATIITEPIINYPEYRINCAEIMFETLNIPYIYFGNQGTFNMAASWDGNTNGTGCVVDIGEGKTSITPIQDMVVIPFAIKSIPIGGKEVTQFIIDELKRREKSVPFDDLYTTAIQIKKRYCSVVKNLNDAFDPNNIIKYTGINSRTKQNFQCDVGYEQFIAPEILLRNEIVDKKFKDSLSESIHLAIQSSPKDIRPKLYQNIVLCGGSSVFPGLLTKLQDEVQDLFDVYNKNWAKKVMDTSKKPITLVKSNVKVVTNKRLKYGAWYGGHMLGDAPNLHENCFNRWMYFEKGPESLIPENLHDFGEVV